MALSVAIQMDPIEGINIDADSTFALALEAQDVWTMTNSMTPLNRFGMESQSKLKAGAKIITVSAVDLNHKANYQDFGRYVEADLARGACDTVSLARPARLQAVIQRELRARRIQEALDATLRTAQDSRQQLDTVLRRSNDAIAQVQEGILIDANGILNVTARDQRTGKEHSVDVKPSYGLTDEQVEAMILESFNKAEDDFRERQVRDVAVAERHFLSPFLAWMTGPFCVLAMYAANIVPQ